MQGTLVASYRLASLSAEGMATLEPLEDGERGSIILTASVAAQDGQIGQVIYASAKAGVNGLVLPMARDLSDIGIRVNSIMPGIFSTPLMLGATPLGHGNNVLTDDDLVLHLRHGVAFVEINLVSNLLLEYVGNYSQHHFPEMLRLGVPCGLSTDDSGMWDSGMTDEYLTAVTEFNLTWEELVRCGRNSLQWSFLEEPQKARLLAEYDRDVRAFEQRFGGDDWASKLRAIQPVAYGFARRRWAIAY